MLKYPNIYLAAMLLLLGATTFSCQKQESAIEETITAQQSQAANEELVAEMSKDSLVRALVLDNIKFANDYSVWFDGLTAEQQQQEAQAVEEASQSGQHRPDPAHTEAQINTFLARQASLADQIKVKYPVFAQMSPEEEQAVALGFSDIIMQSDITMQQSTQERQNCMRGWNACRNYCQWHNRTTSCFNACYAGYQACIAPRTP